MASNMRNLAKTAGVIATSLFFVALWLLNRGIYIIGLSTVTADAKSAPEGLLNLVSLIASADPWILGGLAAAAVAVQFWLAYQAVSFADEARTLHDELNTLPRQVETLRQDVNRFTAKFDDIVKIATNTAKAAVQRQRETAEIKPELERLFDMQQALLLSDCQPEKGWAEWHQRYSEFIEAIEKLYPLIHESLLSSMERKSIKSLANKNHPFDISQSNTSFGNQWGPVYLKFQAYAEELVAIKANIERKMELATVPDLLVEL